MRLDVGDMIVDEFDVYFARAQSAEKEVSEISRTKRGSNPDVNKNLDVPCLRRARSCKSNQKRRGSTKGTPTRDLPTQVRADLDSETEEAGECAGLSNSFNESKLKDAYRLLEVKCYSEPQSRTPSWRKSRKQPRYHRGRSDSASPSLALQRAHDLGIRLEQMTLDVPEVTDRYLAIPQHSPSSSVSSREHTPSPAPGVIRRRNKVDKTARIWKSRSVGTEMYEAGSSGGSATPPCDSELANGDMDEFNEGEIRIHILGDFGVGKKSIVQQLKQKALFASPSVHDEVEIYTTVISKIDGNHERIKLTVIPSEMHHNSFGAADAYILVYSVVNRPSFSHAVNILHEIRRDQEKPNVVILAANKGDLVRSKQVSEEEGKEAAKSYEAKCLEVSVVLNHKIQELLTTTIRQIHLATKKQEKRIKRSGSIKDPKMVGLPAQKSKRNFIGKLFRSKSFAAKSCENLLALT